ncbi:hypothetical protein ACLM5J_00395 [Nocardioides sp. Bht2]|uniref:hypothetical protein n=1 Tax=Nocardioides sp. Bht2 TaxID=3392297 RepID=UPI0039B54583
MTETAYCTILSTNYLPKALALAESLRRHEGEFSLTILLTDARSADQLPVIPALPGVEVVGTDVLGLPERELLHLATIYDLVEFATAVKPLLLKRLLQTSGAAAYLDPDTYLTAPMVELPIDLAATEGGILLTPHFLEPVTDPNAMLQEGHLLNVGVFNLGFCAVDRRAIGFLDWWWGHLERECLWDPISGLFVDQKWVDIGATLFRAGAWRHAGYNVSVANLHERPIAVDDEGLFVSSTKDRLRLFHFHAFDTAHPEELSTRLIGSTSHLREQSRTLDALCREYAEIVMRYEAQLAKAPRYAYAADTAGKPLSRQLRRAYRLNLEDDASLPVPFLAQEAEAWAAWRRGAWRTEAKELAGDAVKSIRLVLPEEYGRIKKRLPGVSSKLKAKLVRNQGIWH